MSSKIMAEASIAYDLTMWRQWWRAKTVREMDWIIKLVKAHLEEIQDAVDTFEEWRDAKQAEENAAKQAEEQAEENAVATYVVNVGVWCLPVGCVP